MAKLDNKLRKAEERRRRNEKVQNQRGKLFRLVCFDSGTDSGDSVYRAWNRNS